MMCLQCGADVDAGIASCPECGKSPYEPPGGFRAPNAPVAEMTAEGGVAAAASALDAPAPPVISVIELSDSQQRRVTFLQQKLDFDPNQPKVLLSLAQVYEEAGDISTALAYYRGCLEVDRLNGYAAGRLAILEAKHGALPSPSVPFAAHAANVHVGTGAAPGSSGAIPANGGELAADGEPRSGSLREPATGSLRNPASGVLRSPGIEPRSTTGAPRPTTGVARPAGGVAALGGARRRPPSREWRWYADPRIWAAVIFVFASAAYISYWQWQRNHHRVLLGKNHPSWGASFSPDGRYLAVYEPTEKPELESVKWGYDGAGQANVRVLASGGGGPVLATFPRAQVWKGSPGPSWGGGRYVLFPTAGGEGWETRVAVGDVQSKVIALTLDGANGQLSPDGRFVAYEKGVEVEADTIGPYRFYSRYKPTRPEIFVFEISTHDDRRLTVDGGYDPVWSPDGRTVLYRRASTTEYMKQGLTYERSDDFETDRRGGGFHPRMYSYKAKRFSGVDLMAVPRDGGEPTVVAHGGMNAHAAWVGRDNHTLSWVHWEYQPEGRDDDDELGGFRSFAYAFGHAADPEDVALEASLMMGSAAGGEAEEVLSPAHDAIRLSTARWSPDGQRLVYERVISDSTMIVANRREGAKLGDFKDETDLHLYDRATKRTVRLTGEGNPHRSQPAWSADGSRLAYMVHEWAIPQVEVASLERLLPRAR